MTTATLYSIPQEPGRWRALALAAAVHVALFALLWIGIRWQSETPVTIEAEVWSPQAQEAAPLPEPVQAVKPEPTPPVVEKPSPAAVEPVVKPNIALEQKKKQKAEAKEHLAKLAEKEKEEQRKADEKAAALAKKKTTDKAEKTAAEKKRLQEAADEKQLAEMRKEELRRISGNTGSGGTSDAAKTQGGRADPSYGQKLSAKIKSHTTFPIPPDLRENPEVEYTVELFPDGSVRNIKKERSSRLPSFDEAVERGIRASSPFPPDASGNVPSSFTFTHKLK